MRPKPFITEKVFERTAEEIRSYIRENVSPFPSDTAAKREERRRRAKEDRFYFYKTYLPHYFEDEFANYHRDMDAVCSAPNAFAILDIFRGGAKSVLETFAHTIYEISFKIESYIILGSETLDQAKNYTRPIKIEFEENPRLQADFKIRPGTTWNEEELIFGHGVKVQARGAGQALRGLRFLQYRPTKIKLDDIQNDESAKSKERVEKIVNWIKAAVIPALDPKRRSLIIVGNRLAYNCVISQFKEMPGFIYFHINSLLDGTLEDGIPAWPARFPLEILRQMKIQMGSVAFNKEMLGVISSEDSPFKEEWIRWYREDDLPKGEISCYEYIDPSIGANQSSDYRAFVKIKRSPAGLIYFRRPDIRKQSISTLVDTTYQRQTEEPAELIGVEGVGFQMVLKELYDEKARQNGIYLPIRMMAQTVNKEVRILSLSPLMERGVFLFLAGCVQTRKLLDQFLEFPNGKYDDGPDAAQGAVKMAQSGGYKIEHQSTGPRASVQAMRDY